MAFFGFASPSPGVGLEQCGGSGDQTLGKVAKSAPFNFAIQLIRQLRAKSLKKNICRWFAVNLTIILFLKQLIESIEGLKFLQDLLLIITIIFFLTILVRVCPGS